MHNYRPTDHGFVEVITGPMFAGKTEALIFIIKREVIAGRRSVIFKPDIDDRYSDSAVVTHNGEGLFANIIPIDQPQFIIDKVEEIETSEKTRVHAVGIDEAQFFSLDIIEVVRELANRGIRVIISGVDVDYRDQPWRPMSDFMSIAEFVEKLSAVCSCGQPATKIQRYRNNRLSHWDEPTIVVGSNIEGDEFQYEAKCRGCYQVPPKLIIGGKDNE
jgi:thymidine kinase